MENLAVTLRALHVAAPVSSSFSLVSSSHLLRAGDVLLSSTLFTHSLKAPAHSQIGKKGSPPPKKTYLSEDDPLGALDELAKIISDVPMNVHWDSTTFGREAQIPLYLHHQDVRELASGREEINITLIQLWMMYMFDVSNKKGFNDVYGFIDPSMTHERNKFDDIQTYITTCFGMGKEIYFLPYIHGYMFDVSYKKGFNDVYGFIDPSMTHERNTFDDIQTYITTCFGMGKEIYFLPYIHGSLATHMMLSGRSTATAKKLAWVALKDCSNSREVNSTCEENTC
ncbi:hypothetical protein LR48_Vigan08g113400 [Vigna angularis]|uniref:Uncharacterized protein n=1 Tax=Phaseolus angularis TaxID=3914 RepID=A0A0L9V5T0_PHAAN|nr:hypothetical protein LR48_Vigan08g113400 [Vigna angularis]